jgi:TPR repeat protein
LETGDDSLVTEGEKYLYGNGVPENCARARKDLLAAAEHSNARAQSVLGTMYATGHCATRDLPFSVRWPQCALHKDPTNTRIEQKCEILWGQMSTTERQIAQSKEQ